MNRNIDEVVVKHSAAGIVKGGGSGLGDDVVQKCLVRYFSSVKQNAAILNGKPPSDNGSVFYAGFVYLVSNKNRQDFLPDERDFYAGVIVVNESEKNRFLTLSVYFAGSNARHRCRFL